MREAHSDRRFYRREPSPAATVRDREVVRPVEVVLTERPATVDGVAIRGLQSSS